MLGRYIRVRVTHPIGSINPSTGAEYHLNYGVVEGTKRFDYPVSGAYIMGIAQPVRNFDGRVIALIHRNADKRTILIAAPKQKRFINHEIRTAIAAQEAPGSYTLDCLYEHSCGAVVYRIIQNEPRFLLIRNKRSAHWGFPKGHVEPGETPEETAKREVLEETGLRIQILPDFSSRSEYTIQGRVEKRVEIFVAQTHDTKTTIQEEEIADYLWLNYDKAMQHLRFDNDRDILQSAYNFLANQNYI